MKSTQLIYSKVPYLNVHVENTERAKKLDEVARPRRTARGPALSYHQCCIRYKADF